LKFGFCAPNYGKESGAGIIRKSTLAGEKLGYESVWLTDHILMPAKSGTPYERIFETVTTLAYLSGITRSIKLGISSLVLPLRNPIIVAKQISNLDVLSKGRTMLCVSSGWNETEYCFLGSNFHDRGKRLDDSLLLLRALWKGGSEFQGKNIKQHFSGGAHLDPKPIQDSIPIWIGGLSDRSMERAIKYGDAWHPNAHPLPEFGKMIRRFHDMNKGRKKDIAVRIPLDLELQETKQFDKKSRSEGIAFCSNTRENKELIEKFERLGITYIIVVPSSLPVFAGELFHDAESLVVRNLESFARQVM
jgi:probable F420-dependent oxidoreductase